MTWKSLCMISASATALLSGCAGMSSDGSDYGIPIGMREQKAILAKGRPVTEFGFTPSFPFGDGTLYIGGTLLQANQMAELGFLEEHMPVLEIRGASAFRKLRILIDTAANASQISYNAARRNDVIFLQNNGMPIPYLGTDSTAGALTYAGVIPELRIDQLFLSNTPFYVHMMKGSIIPAVYSASSPRVDAVLGYDNLRQFQYIRFDLAANTVRFSTSTPYTPAPDRLVGTAGLSSVCLDRLAVNGAVGGLPVPVVLDFAGDYAFARGDTRESVTAQMEMGEIVNVNVPTTVLAVQDLYPRAGRKLLAKYVVTVCPRNGVVYFERPAGQP